MPGPSPKPEHLRQRRNKSVTRACLTAADGVRRRAPSLPFRGKDENGAELAWLPITRAWWKTVWHSPMAAEYLQADVFGLFRLAVLLDQFWCSPSAQLDSEISRLEQKFGLSPLDRRRLEWSVEQVEQVKERRQSKQQPRVTPKPADDPREMLRLMK